MVVMMMMVVVVLLLLLLLANLLACYACLLLERRLTQSSRRNGGPENISTKPTCIWRNEHQISFSARRRFPIVAVCSPSGQTRSNRRDETAWGAS
ncbi:hypothetical protein F4810DRAFT_676912 [Camillea tinctor]|nr:hypothetical protein F4810DRAFT_676912 [Camillea tinctor]